MSASKMRVRAWVILFALIGIVLAWIGGFLLSSGYSRCVDGVEGGQCSGRYASDGWHVAGVVGILLSGVLIIAGIAAAVRSRGRGT